MELRQSSSGEASTATATCAAASESAKSGTTASKSTTRPLHARSGSVSKCIDEYVLRITTASAAAVEANAFTTIAADAIARQALEEDQYVVVNGIKFKTYLYNIGSFQNAGDD